VRCLCSPANCAEPPFSVSFRCVGSETGASPSPFPVLVVCWRSFSGSEWVGEARLAILARCLSSFQINPNGEELRPEEAHRPSRSRRCSAVDPPAWLAFAWIVVGEQVRRARVSVVPQPLTQLQPYMRITLNVADVSRLHPMLCH